MSHQGIEQTLSLKRTQHVLKDVTKDFRFGAQIAHPGRARIEQRILPGLLGQASGLLVPRPNGFP